MGTGGWTARVVVAGALPLLGQQSKRQELQVSKDKMVCETSLFSGFILRPQSGLILLTSMNTRQTSRQEAWCYLQFVFDHTRFS